MGLLASLVKPGSVISVAASASVAEAAKKMAENRVGSVVVMDGNKTAGIFTERDLLNRVIARNLNVESTTVADVMSKNICSIPAKETVQNCFNMMQKTKCRHLPIVENDKIVGMVTMRNILEWLIEEMEAENIQLKKYIQS